MSPWTHTSFTERLCYSKLLNPEALLFVTLTLALPKDWWWNINCIRLTEDHSGVRCDLEYLSCPCVQCHGSSSKRGTYRRLCYGCMCAYSGTQLNVCMWYDFLWDLVLYSQILKKCNLVCCHHCLVPSFGSFVFPGNVLLNPKLFERLQALGWEVRRTIPGNRRTKNLVHDSGGRVQSREEVMMYLALNFTQESSDFVWNFI